ncbi:PTS cellobiose transporter subunit IIB [Weissella confusa]|uniref:PTS sugar transporter subunit IIB n=1 Tax=Weissella confusa TaxID=1583 RepID=UPI001C0FB52C|nr:PTS cellobiose transporter subunit IIB [Weissella confusa]MBU5285866.1 PTS cellobiose transporter subunit IIB [Weissella confusa]MDY2529506.1 PTS cellobiose transporter subunit IIB [Weissella confusa]
MTKHIVLVDAAGMSISMLANKMNDTAEKDGLDVSTVGVADMVARDQIAKDQPIVIMIAPQVKYMHARYEEEYGADYPVVDINMMDYGMMKGEAILQAALASERK